MKKVALIVALVSCMVAGNYSFGQDGATPPPPPRAEKNKGDLKTPEQKAEARTKRMQEGLNLTEAQVVEVKNANLSHIREMEGIKKQMKELKRKAKETRKRHEDELNGLLTPEQQQKHNEMKENRKHKHECKNRPE